MSVLPHSPLDTCFFTFLKFHFPEGAKKTEMAAKTKNLGLHIQ